ncbi:MAG: hypothetical protein AAGF98_08325 [Cyanobacteria bacterium P01_H01_bin.153]
MLRFVALQRLVAIALSLCPLVTSFVTINLSMVGAFAWALVVDAS